MYNDPNECERSTRPEGREIEKQYGIKMWKNIFNGQLSDEDAGRIDNAITSIAKELILARENKGISPFSVDIL